MKKIFSKRSGGELKATVKYLKGHNGSNIIKLQKQREAILKNEEKINEYKLRQYDGMLKEENHNG